MGSACGGEVPSQSTEVTPPEVAVPFEGWADGNFLQGDRDVVRTAAVQNFRALGYVALDLLNDKAFMGEMCAQLVVGKEAWRQLCSLPSYQVAPRLLQYAPPEVRADLGVARAAGYGGLEFAEDNVLSDKAFMLEMCTADGQCLQFAKGGLRADRDVVLTALLQRDSSILDFADDKVLGDKAAMLEFCAAKAYSLKYAKGGLQGDRDVVLAAAGRTADALQYAEDELLSDKDFMIKLCAADSSTLEFAKGGLRGDKDVVRALTGWCGLAYVEDSLLSDKAFMLEMCTVEGRRLQHAKGGLRSDREVVRTAAVQNFRALGYAALDVLNDKAFMDKICTELVVGKEAWHDLCEQNARLLRYAPPEFRSDRGIVLAAGYEGMKCALADSDDVLSDKAFMLEMCTADGYRLGWAQGGLKADRDVVRAAALQHAAYLMHFEALELFAEDVVLSDKAFMLEMCAVRGDGLKFAKGGLQSDKDVVRTAIRQDSDALAYATEQLLSDKAFMLEMCALDGRCLQHAKGDLWSDKDVVHAAALQNPDALQYADDVVASEVRKSLAAPKV